MPVILDTVCPVTQGGIPGREEATGRGVQYVLREFFRHLDDVARSGLEGSVAKSGYLVTCLRDLPRGVET